jgi:hypothetical protein
METGAGGYAGGGAGVQVATPGAADVSAQATRWDDRIRDAATRWDKDRDARDRYVREFRLGRFGKAKDGDGVSVNLCFSVTSIFLALLYAQPATVTVDPRRREDRGQVAFAEALETWLAYSLRETGGELANQVVVFDALLRGVAWSKESFDPERGCEVVDALSPLDVYVDPAARYSVAQARYVIQRCVKPVDDVRARYPQAGVEPNYELATEKGLAGERVQGAGQGQDKDLVEYFEIWERAPGGARRLYVRDYIRRKWLHQGEWPYLLDADEFPFSPLVFNTQFTALDGFSEQEVVEGLRVEVEEMAEFDRRHTRRAAAKKVLYLKDLLEEGGAAAMQSGKDMEFIGVAGGGYSLADVVRVVDLNSPTDEQEKTFARAKMLHDEVLGVYEFQRGGQTKKLTATQAEIEDDFSKLRVSRRIKAVDAWQRMQARHRAQIARQWVAPELVARAAGAEAGMAWAVYAGDLEDLLREFSVEIEPGSAGERARRQREQSAKDNLQLFSLVNQARLAMQLPPVFDVVEAGLEVLRARGVRNPERFLLAQNAPVAGAGGSALEALGMPPGGLPGGVPPEAGGMPGQVPAPAGPAGAAVGGAGVGPGVLA